MKKFVWIILTVMMVLTGIPGGAEVLAAENKLTPVIDWRANIAGQCLEDSAAGGLNIDLSGNANWSDAGMRFGAMDGITFHAGNAVTSKELGIWDAINGASGVTISAVLKVTGAGGTVIKITPTNAALGLYITSGKIRVEARSQNGDAWKAYETTGAVMDFGENAGWHRVDVAFDYAGKKIRFYLDNRLCETIEATNWTSGRLQYTPSDKYSTIIGNTTIVLAQLQLYNQALTETDVEGRFDPAWSCDFDETEEGAALTEVADTSGYGVNLSVGAGDAAAVKGMQGNSVQFTAGCAENADTLSLNKRLNGAGAVTVSFWQKFTGESEPNDYVFKLTGGGNALLALKPGMNKTFFMVRSYGDKKDGVPEPSNFTEVQTPGLADGMWHHFMLEADYASGAARLYLDGALAGEKLNLDVFYPHIQVSTRAQLHLGSPNVLLDNVKVYARVLDETERAYLLAEHPVLTAKMLDAYDNETVNPGEMKKIVCTITNLKSTPLQCALVGAGYAMTPENTEILTGVDAREGIVVAENGRQSVELTGAAAAENEKVRIILLDSLDTLRPLEAPHQF